MAKTPAALKLAAFFNTMSKCLEKYNYYYFITASLGYLLLYYRCYVSF